MNRGNRNLQKLLLTAVLFLALCGSSSAYPRGWWYMQWPYAYSDEANAWFYLNEANTQYTHNMNTAVWSTWNAAGPKTGWIYFAWPYAYSIGQNAWHYFDVSSAFYIMNFRSGEWELLAKNRLVVGTLSPVRDLVRHWTGGGQYYDYGEWSGFGVYRNNLIGANVTMDFQQFLDGSYQVTVHVQVNSSSSVSPLGAWNWTAESTRDFVSPVVVSGTRITFGPSFLEQWEFNYTSDLLEGQIIRTDLSRTATIATEDKRIKLIRRY